MGHSYKGQAVPFSGQTHVFEPNRPPVLTASPGLRVSWENLLWTDGTEFVQSYSFDGGISWTVDAPVPATNLFFIEGAAVTIRGRLKKGGVFSPYSNSVLAFI